MKKYQINKILSLNRYEKYYLPFLYKKMLPPLLINLSTLLLLKLPPSLIIDTSMYKCVLIIESTCTI